jgi:hypothetical protein
MHALRLDLKRRVRLANSYRVIMTADRELLRLMSLYEELLLQS